MRITLVTLLCTLVLSASGGTGVRADDKSDIKTELKKWEGTWTFESVEAGGMKLSADLLKGMSVTYEGDKYSVKMGNMVVEAATLKLDPSKSPKTFDSTVSDGPNKGTVLLGIYEFDGDTVKVCFDPEGKKRPTEFKTAADSQTTLIVQKRVKK
jgi:uncharacterized protein (TIGR03067 family)